MKKALPVILMLMVFSSTLYAQGVTVRGTVKDANEEPLIGASVKVKGNASLGTVTDLDGNFSFTVPSEATTLVFSYVGMTTREIKVGRQRVFNVVLDDNAQMEEVVVVGFGQQKKLSLVGAITQTTGDVLERSLCLNR